MDILLVSGVTDFVQGIDELIELILLESNTYVESVIGWGRTIIGPPFRCLDPSMLDLKVGPSLGK